MNKHNSIYSSQRSLNKLAENGTTYDFQKTVVVQGKGSDLGNQRFLKGKGKRKLITQKNVIGLINSYRENSLISLDSLWNTFHCQNHVYTANGRIYGTYCKNRFCTICCAIRKADIINRYLPVMQKWKQPYMVTLTVKAVPRYKLKGVMQSMISELHKIIEMQRKKHQRGKGIKLIGIRSLESNFNPIKKTYNPHFHFIVADEEMADILIREWLKRSHNGWTNNKAQKKDPVFNNVVALIEVVKYGSKIFTEPDLRKKVKIKGQGKIYLRALSNILNAMKGLRIFERFVLTFQNNRKNLCLRIY